LKACCCWRRLSLPSSLNADLSDRMVDSVYTIKREVVVALSPLNLKLTISLITESVTVKLKPIITKASPLVSTPRKYRHRTEVLTPVLLAFTSDLTLTI